MRLPFALLLLTMLPAGSTGLPFGREHSTTAAPVERAEFARDEQQFSQYRRTDFRSLRLAGPFPAVVTDVIDGDTFEAKVTIWLGHEVTTRVRLLGIDAAEMSTECAEERELALVSRGALARMLGGVVELSDVRFDKYGGRVLARARSRAHADVSDAMLAGGYAIAYEGGRRQMWCDPVVTSRR